LLAAETLSCWLFKIGWLFLQPALIEKINFMILIDCMENSVTASAGYLVGGLFVILVVVTWIAAGKLREVENLKTTI
jgi:hypothetical protein